MQKTDIVAVAFMTFAFFLGAGNLIFPTFSGQLAGENVWWTALGFFITDVGISILAIVAIAIAGGPTQLTKDLPTWVSLPFWLSVYIIIGPAFAVPRTASVAYETGVVPWLSDFAATFSLPFFTIVFFIAVSWMCLNPGKLVTMVGRILTPLLGVFLGAIYISMMMRDHDPLGEPLGNYRYHPVTEGVIQGYNTMDALGALAFGIVIVLSVKRLGVTDKSALIKYTTLSSALGGVCLCLVYVGLFYMGATSRSIVPDAQTGAEILRGYIYDLMGLTGQFALTLVIVVACLTTAIGVTTACADYFRHEFKRISYNFWVVFLCSVSGIVANLGLKSLITYSIPVVTALYPVAMVIVFLGLLRGKFQIHRNTFVWTVYTVLSFSIIEASLDKLHFFKVKVDGMSNTILEIIGTLPFSENGMAWILPCVVVFCVMSYIYRRTDLSDASLDDAISGCADEGREHVGRLG